MTLQSVIIRISVFILSFLCFGLYVSAQSAQCLPDDLTAECSELNNQAILDSWNAANESKLLACASIVCDSSVVFSDYDFSRFDVACEDAVSISVTYTIEGCGNSTQVSAVSEFSNSGTEGEGTEGEGTEGEGTEGEDMGGNDDTSCGAVGGMLLTIETDTTEVTICVGSDMGDAVYAKVWEAEGDSFLYIVTDENGNILQISDGFIFQFVGTGGGTNYIYHVSTVGDVSGIEVGSNISDISGCFELSNSIKVNKEEGDCGCSMIVSLGEEPIVICEGESITIEADVLNSNVCEILCEEENAGTLVEWDMDACHSITNGVDNKDFSELAPNYPNADDCVNVEATPVNVEGGMHSCTVPMEGLGGRAMCFSGSKKCYWKDDSPDALKFSVTLTPENSSTITGLQFYESAPKRFTWYNPDFSEDIDEGPNNFPRFYGLRVTKNGEEIYQQNDIPTTNDWTLEEFDFSDNDAFKVTENTTFVFELLAYCPAWRNAITYAWDLDNIRLLGGCCEKDTRITEVDYEWSTGETTETITVTPTEDTEYSVTVTDCAGCVATHTLPIQVNDPVSADLGDDIIVCREDLPVLLIHSIAGMDATVEWSTGEVGESISVSESGTYSVTVTDGIACSDTDEISLIVNDPDPLALPDSNSINPLCPGSTIDLVTLEPSGQTGGIWTNTSGDAVSNVGAGDYTYTYTDSNGCTVSDQVTISEDNFSFVIDDQGPICPDTDFDFSSIVPEGVDGDNWLVVDQGDGSYSLTGINANGCTASADFNVSIDDFNITLIDPPVLCEGEVYMLMDQVPSDYPGGTWTDMDGNVVDKATPGMFTYTVSNDNGCTSSDKITFTSSGFVLMQIPDDSVCWGDSLLLSTLEFPEESGGFWKDLNNNVVTHGFQDEFYRYHLFDDVNGCAVIVTMKIHEKECGSACDGFTVSVNSPDAICDDESLTLSTLENDATSGGTWNNADGSEVTSGSIGTYTYTYTNGEGCTATAQAEVRSKECVDPCDGFNISFTSPDAICNDATFDLSTLIPAVAAGGEWKNADGAVVTSVGQGTYTYSVTTSEGCSASADVTVSGMDCSDPCEEAILILADPAAICTDATINLNDLVPAELAGGAWTDTDGNGVTEVPSGIYTYTLTNSDGCEVSATITIEGMDCNTDPCDNHIPTLDLGDDVTICNDDAPYIYIASLTCTETIQYSSSTANTEIEISGDTLFVFASGSIDVVVTGPNGEQAEDNILVIIESCNANPCEGYVASKPDLGQDREVCESEFPIIIQLETSECIKGVTLGKVGDAEISDDNSQIIINGPGDFTVSLIDVNDNTTAIDSLSITVKDCTDPEPATPCDDGNPNTENDVMNDDCNCCGTPVSGQVIYVDAEAVGSADGTSWTDALTDLQEAMQSAEAGQEIWLADGVYLPTQDGNRDAYFNLPSGVDLYGGFQGGESTICQRDFDEARSVLSGDLNQDDKVDVVNIVPLELLFTGTEENSHYVLRNSQVSDDIKIDGVAISGGVADGSDTAGGGGFLFVNEEDATLEMNNVLVIHNQGAGLGGAGRINTRSATIFTVKMNRVVFLQNQVSGPALSKGGGLFAAGWDGGLVDMSLSNCLFAQNFAQNRGGAVNADDNVMSEYINTIFAGNKASDGGAIFDNSNGIVLHLNSTFYINFADEQGGAIVNFNNFDDKPIDVQNSIFFGNASTLAGGPGLSNFGDANNNFIISNCLFSEVDLATLESQAVGMDDRGGNQFAADPLFVDPLNADFTLQATSPAIDAGNGANSSMDDILGKVRVQGAAIDLGANEFGDEVTCNFDKFDFDLGYAPPIYDEIEFVTEEEEIGSIEASDVSVLTYPNPTSDVINVLVNKFTLEDEVSLTLYDVSGRSLPTSYSVNNDNGMTVEYNIPVKDFRGGVYFLKTKVGRFTINKRVIVIK